MPVWPWLVVGKGRVTTRWPEQSGPDGQAGVLGLPRLDRAKCTTDKDGCRECIAACPAQALVMPADGGIGIDYGRCVGCQLCTEVCPTDAFTPSSDWAFAARRRADLATFGGDAATAEDEAGLAAEMARFGRSLHIRHVDAGSCNGCESELQALLNPFYNLHRLGIFFTPSPRFADLLLVTGPVTAAMREPLLNTWEAMPRPRWVLALGSCATGGGVNGGGPACHNGLEGILPVDVWLTGCPPNPAAIIEALLLLLRRRPQRVHGGRHES